MQISLVDASTYNTCDYYMFSWLKSIQVDPNCLFICWHTIEHIRVLCMKQRRIKQKTHFDVTPAHMCFPLLFTRSPNTKLTSNYKLIITYCCDTVHTLSKLNLKICW